MSSAKELVERAFQAQKNAYCPYSKFRVGAALLTECERVFTGCNVENAAYPCGICAERTAICKAVSEGYQKFEAIAIIGDSSEITTPCGECRQVIREFSTTIAIHAARKDKSFESFTLEKLLPSSFGPNHLG